MIRRTMTIQAFTVGTCSAALYFVSPSQVLGFVLGAFIVTINFVLLGEVFRGLLAKKSIARRGLVVVIKYATLWGLLYLAVVKLKVPMISFFTGMITLLVSIVLAAVVDRTQES